MTDFNIFRGEDRQLDITITNENGDAVSLADASVEFAVYNNDFDTSVIIQKTSSAPNTNPVTFQLSETDTDIEPKLYRWQATVDDTSTGVTYKAEQGRLNLERAQ